MRRAFRLTAGWAALLFGLAWLFLLARALIFAGWPEGFKAVAYLLCFTLTVFLPVSLGVNVVWQLTRWRRFAGWWLIALGVIHLAAMALIAPELRHYRLDILAIGILLVAASAPFVAFLPAGLLLLLTRRSPNDAG